MFQDVKLTYFGSKTIFSKRLNEIWVRKNDNFTHWLRCEDLMVYPCSLSLEPTSGVFDRIYELCLIRFMNYVLIRQLTENPENPWAQFGENLDQRCNFYLTSAPGAVMQIYQIIGEFRELLNPKSAFFSCVVPLFSEHILPKTSDFPFWTHLFSRSTT